MKISFESSEKCCLGQYSIKAIRCIKDHESVLSYTVGWLSTHYSDKVCKAYRHNHVLFKKNIDHYIVRCIIHPDARIIDSSMHIMAKHPDARIIDATKGITEIYG